MDALNEEVDGVFDLINNPDSCENDREGIAVVIMNEVGLGKVVAVITKYGMDNETESGFGIHVAQLEDLDSYDIVLENIRAVEFSKKFGSPPTNFKKDKSSPRLNYQGAGVTVVGDLILPYLRMQKFPQNEVEKFKSHLKNIDPSLADEETVSHNLAYLKNIGLATNKPYCSTCR